MFSSFSGSPVRSVVIVAPGDPIPPALQPKLAQNMSDHWLDYSANNSDQDQQPPQGQHQHHHHHHHHHPGQGQGQPGSSLNTNEEVYFG